MSKNLSTLLQLPPATASLIGGVKIGNGLSIDENGILSFSSTSTSTLTPTILPSLNLDFANSKSLDTRITFTRSSNGSYTNAQGLVAYAAVNQARFDHDPTTLQCKGLLIEESRVNLLTYSEDFENSVWNKGACTVTANATTAPDGTITADLLTATGSDSYIIQTVTFSALTPFAYSVYLRASTPTSVSVCSRQFPSNTDVCNLDVAVTTEWQRFTITGTTVSGTTSLQVNVGGFGRFTTGETVYAWGAQLEQGLFATSYIPTLGSFTSRSSTATYYGSNGLIQTASANTARINYNPANLTIPGKILLEPAATNLLTYSEQFDNTAWGKNNVTVTANTTIAPDGASTADTVTITNVVDPYVVYALADTSNSFTMSIFVKAGNSTLARFRIIKVGGTTRDASFIFNTTTKTFSSILLNGSTLAYQYGYQDVGNGWFRLWAYQPFETGQTTVELRISSDYVVGNYIYAWGAQVETGTSATSYIPTTSTSASRSADVSSSSSTTRGAELASITGTNFSNWYRQDEGSIVVKSDTMYATPSAPRHTVMFANSIDYSKIVLKNCRPSSFTGYTIWDNSDTVQCELSSATTVAANTMHSIAVAYKTNDCAMSTDGATVTTDTTVVLPTDIIKMYVGGVPLLEQNGHIANITYYPKRLTNAELQALSTQ